MWNYRVDIFIPPSPPAPPPPPPPPPPHTHTHTHTHNQLVHLKRFIVKDCTTICHLHFRNEFFSSTHTKYVYGLLIKQYANTFLPLFVPCLWWSYDQYNHGLFTRYVKLTVAHAPGMSGTFSPPPWVSDPACITARAWPTWRDACRDR